MQGQSGPLPIANGGFKPCILQLACFHTTAPFVSVLALPIAATLPSGGYSVSSGGMLLASSGLQQVICCRLCQLDPLLRAC